MKRTTAFFLMFDSDSSENEYMYHDQWINSALDMDELQFLESFRMSITCYQSLRNDILSFQAVRRLDSKLLSTLYYLGHAITMRQLREQMGLPTTSIFRYLEEITTIFANLAKEKITFPTIQVVGECISGMAEVNSHNIYYAIDGSEIPINRPSINPFNYYNRKGFFSIKIICVCDFKLRIRGMTYGYGAQHDSSVYRVSNLRIQIESLSQYGFQVVEIMRLVDTKEF